MNIVPKYERFDNNGLELIVEINTGKAYASLSATARMLGISKSTALAAFDNHKTTEGQVSFPSGSKVVRLASSDVVFELAVDYNPVLAKQMGSAGANVYMLGLAGYSVEVKESPTIEQDRQKLERNLLPTPAIKQLKEMYAIKKMMYGKAYANRWMGQMEKQWYPALVGDAPSPEEVESLPTPKALLTPTEIALQLGWFCKSNQSAGDARAVNKKLDELGYQTKIGGVWSGTDKAIDAKLCDRKPVETGSRTQKDQLLWSIDVLPILSEHSTIG